ncbi:MAG: 4-alpha-glucanotransferase [Pseudomonadales bacterium]|nr:4-alpha-glucanotransferase [Pseudomonadales bacterium]MBP9032927.1 4-alpha-glucanotransferase [Pseudomonadales bacterium]
MSNSLFATRRAGVLLHPSSLPSPFGNGDLGHAAYRFVEFLARAGCTVWQVLPLGPTHEDLSPYDSTSVHAGNPRLISLDWLRDRGLLEDGELDAVRSGVHARQWALDAAYPRFAAACARDETMASGFAAWCAAREWLEGYTLFTAIRELRGALPWYQWEPALRGREPATLAHAAAGLAPRIAALRFEQYAFAQQWTALRQYACAHGVSLFGDMPIFVAHDSADVWSARELFLLDAEGHPLTVAGVPPDYFSADGQRWGNPHYAWDVMARDGFAWWRRRIASQRERFDLVRIDHFRGFEACWHIPRESASAVHGHWEPAPGEALLRALVAESGDGSLVAENLGIITPQVERLRERFGLPGMLILQFAFDGDARNTYLPHNHQPLNVVYTGTHDNDTSLGWFASLDESRRARVMEYLGMPVEPMPWPLVRAALASVARLAVLPLQDLLGLGSEHRMNLPGVAQGNWAWQFCEEQLTPALAVRLRAMVELYGRKPS